MDLDALLHNYFGTTEIDTLDDGAIEEGRERLGIAFGTERDSGRRFALWVLLHGLGGAPDPATAFKNPRERDAALAYARAAARVDIPEA
jgi:hypothetical protein